MITAIAIILVVVVLAPFALGIIGVGALALVFCLGILAYPFVWLWAVFLAVTEKS